MGDRRAPARSATLVVVGIVLARPIGPSIVARSRLGGIIHNSSENRSIRTRRSGG